MRNATKLLVSALLACAIWPSHAQDTVHVRRWNDAKNGYDYTTEPAQTTKTSGGSVVTPWGVVLPSVAGKLAVQEVECIVPTGMEGVVPVADKCALVSWAETRGELRVRALVRYGWFDEFDSDYDKPILEIFVHKDSKLALPHMDGWTPGWVDEFTLLNEDWVIAQLFDPQAVQRVKSKKRQFIEVDSDLLLDQIGFGSECGLRFTAKAVSVKPWADAKVVARSKGWEGHC